MNGLGSPWEIDRPGIILKKYPSCAFTHPAIDAALTITRTSGYVPSDLERVEGHIHSLRKSDPHSSHPRDRSRGKVQHGGLRVAGAPGWRRKQRVF